MFLRTPRIITPAASKGDRKSTRLNSSHGYISYAVFCLKKKNCIPIMVPVLPDRLLTRLPLSPCLSCTSRPAHSSTPAFLPAPTLLSLFFPFSRGPVVH